MSQERQLETKSNMGQNKGLHRTHSEALEDGHSGVVRHEGHRNKRKRHSKVRAKVDGEVRVLGDDGWLWVGVGGLEGSKTKAIFKKKPKIMASNTRGLKIKNKQSPGQSLLQQRISSFPRTKTKFRWCESKKKKKQWRKYPYFCLGTNRFCFLKSPFLSL